MDEIKINRFFNRIIQEETQGETLYLKNEIVYSYGISEEGKLFQPDENSMLILCSRNDDAQSLAEGSATERLMGTIEIPTVMQCVVDNLRTLVWNKNLSTEYGELFKNNIVAPYQLDLSVVENFNHYDAILHKSKWRQYLILFGSKKLIIYKYQFFTKEYGWGDWYGYKDAKDFVNSLFEVRDTPMHF